MLIILLLLISLLITVESLKFQSSSSSLSLYQLRHRLSTRCYYNQQIDNDNTNNIISSNITTIATTTTATTTITTPTNNTDDNNLINSYLLLNLVAIIYGTQHPIIKISMNDFSSTSLVNFWRFFSSALLFSPAFIQLFFNDIKNNEMMIDSNNNDSNNNKYDIYKAGIELGIYTFLGFAFQAIGLETTTASRSAFLLYLNVKFVPFLALILFKRPVHPLSWLSATLALIGTSLLSTDGGSLNAGDIWCICAAIVSAMFIIRLDNFSKLFNAAQLNSISFISVAFLCGLWVIGDMLYNNNTDDIFTSILTPFIENPWPIIYLGVITTGLCNYIQTIGQKKIPAEKAAIVYSLDPLYGAFFSWLWLHEQLGLQGFIGGATILCGVYVSSKVPQNKT